MIGTAAPLDAVVVGAGVSGLTVAWGLRRRGFTVQVIEAAARPGGVIRSLREQGCLLECGPNSALDTTPRIGELIASLGLQAEQRWASSAAARRYVVKAGVLTPLPTSPMAFVASRLFSLRAKLALLREPFVRASAASAEESIADFVRRRLGSEFLDWAIDPFVAGIYAGDPEQISVPAAFPKLHALEQRWGSLVRGQWLGARERGRAGMRGKNSARSFSFANGMQVLTDGLARAVGELSLDTRALRIVRGAGGLFTLHAERHGETLGWRSRALVLATPADATAALLREHAADAAAALEAIDYAPLASVASAYACADIAHPLDGFGCLAPRKAQRRVLGVLFSSSMFDGRAPAGTALLTSFVGGQRQAALARLPEAEVAALSHAEHVALLGVRGAPLFQVVTRWSRAIPQYTLGHLARVARAEAAGQAWPGLFFCANWRGGVSVGDRIERGEACASDVAGYLGSGGAAAPATASAAAARAATR